MQNPHFGSKIQIPKHMSKSILQFIYSCSVQKTAPENTKYSRNQPILKIGLRAKPIADEKSLLWVKNKKFQKTSQNPFCKSFRVVLCKRPLEKTLTLREMGPF